MKFIDKSFKRTRECPMFLVPIRKEGGYFNLLGQNQRKSFVNKGFFYEKNV